LEWNVQISISPSSAMNPRTLEHIRLNALR
jgi:hypothetical protein